MSLPTTDVSSDNIPHLSWIAPPFIPGSLRILLRLLMTLAWRRPRSVRCSLTTKGDSPHHVLKYVIYCDGCYPLRRPSWPAPISFASRSTLSRSVQSATDVIQAVVSGGITKPTIHVRIQSLPPQFVFSSTIDVPRTTVLSAGCFVTRYTATPPLSHGSPLPRRFPRSSNVGEPLDDMTLHTLVAMCRS